MNRFWRSALASGAFLLLSIIFSSQLNAQVLQATAPNGCGSGWNRYFVPDSIPVAKCDFRASCDVHDICYGRCETSIDGQCQYRRCQTGGDLFKSPLCVTDRVLFESTQNAVDRRRRCDKSFYETLRNANSGKAVCEAFAIVYRAAVKNFGANAFIGAGDLGAALPQDQDDYERQIREFFRTGTEAEFRSLVEKFDAGALQLNMARPIKFRPGEGLSND